MNYSTTMENNTNDWAQTGTILGVVLGFLALAWKWITESFKARRDEKEAVIRIAVMEAMSDVRTDIEKVRTESADGLKHVHSRIDQIFERLGK